MSYRTVLQRLTEFTENGQFLISSVWLSDAPLEIKQKFKYIFSGLWLEKACFWLFRIMNYSHLLVLFDMRICYVEYLAFLGMNKYFNNVWCIIA